VNQYEPLRCLCPTHDPSQRRSIDRGGACVDRARSKAVLVRELTAEMCAYCVRT
jgi:hypothetical protein